METTNEFMDAVKARYGLPSDYALAAKLGTTRSLVSAYRNNKRMLGDDTAVTVAKLLELDAGYVLACVAAERTQNPKARHAWEHAAEILKTYGAAAALLLLVAVPALTPTPANAAPLLASAGDCVLC